MLEVEHTKSEWPKTSLPRIFSVSHSVWSSTSDRPPFWKNLSHWWTTPKLPKRL